jgi:hypothetical protein
MRNGGLGSALESARTICLGLLAQFGVILGGIMLATIQSATQHSAFAQAGHVGIDGDFSDQNDLGQSGRERLSPLTEGSVPFAIRLAGALRVDSNYISQDVKGARPSSARFDNRRDVALFGSASADNGLRYGFEYDIDENRATLNMTNRYGRVDLGDADPATEALEVMGADAMVGRGGWASGGNGVLLLNDGGIAGLGVVTARPNSRLRTDDAGGTVRYTSPNVGGLSVAVSYTEETDTDMTDGSGSNTAEDVWSFAGQFVSSYGNYTSVAYGGIERSNIADIAGPRGDFDIYSAGILVRGLGAALGVGWGMSVIELPRSLAIKDDTREWIDAGLALSSGPWGVSIGGAHATDEAVFVDRIIDTSITAVSATFDYRIAPGLSLSGGLTHWQINNGFFIGAADAVVDADGRADSEALVFTLSTQMSF